MTRLSPRVQANFDFILLCWIWGSTWLAIKVGLNGVPPATSAAARFIIAGILLLLVAALARRRWPSDSSFRLHIAVQGVALAIDYFLIYWAEQTVPSGLTAVLFATFPIFTGAIAGLVLRMERFNYVNTLGLIAGLVGLCVIFWSEVIVAARTPWQGMAAIVLGALIAAVSTTSIKRWGSDIPALLIAAPSQLLCGLLLGALALIVDRGHAIVVTPTVVASVAYLAVFGSAIAFVAYYQLLRLIPATRATMLNYVTPVVALILGAALAHERLDARTLIGALLILASIGLMHVKAVAPVEEAAL